jgi:CheY-like chemotaxis protein
MAKYHEHTLLIVDDELALRNSMVFDFKRKGFTVLAADGGRAGFELILKNKVDLVISDMRMPDGDGLCLLERVSAYNPKIPVLIFLTGSADITEEYCLSKGARRVLSKPFDRKVLFKAVLESLGLDESDGPAASARSRGERSMNSEREFLHDISNRIAAAKVALEIAIEFQQESSSPNAQEQELLTSALDSITSLVSAVEKRRAETKPK